MTASTRVAEWLEGADLPAALRGYRGGTFGVDVAKHRGLNPDQDKSLPGLFVSLDWVSMLAEHNGAVDIDQYVSRGPG